MTLVGFTALSVDTSTKVSTSVSCAASAVFQVAITLLVNALDHVLLDDRHVLVGGGVIDGLHPIGHQNLAHAQLVMGVADQADQIDGEGMLIGERAKLPLDVVERELRHLEQHQTLWAQADDLSA